MTTNPFIPPPPQVAPEERDSRDAVFGDAFELHGPQSPESAPPVVVGAADPWPQVAVTSREPLMVMGLHGGAATTTVAGLLGEAALDVGTAWPVAGGWERPLPTLNVVAVCRNHRAGVDAGTRFARQWADSRLPASNLLGLVIVDDGPQLLQAQKSATKRLAQMTPRGWHIPWCEQWRIGDPVLDSAPRRVKKTIRKIQSLVKE